jgi:elongator complex protein 3
VADTARSFQVTKDAGLKLNAHLMPGLPGSTFESDREQFRILFEDPRFGPDMLKIYPTLVIPGTGLFRMMERGQFTPVDEDYCVRLIAEAKARFVPRWVRIQRVDRDIPSNVIAGGVTKLNLRQMVQSELERRGVRCPCVRCREAGRVPDGPEAAGALRRRETVYASAGGKEHFVERLLGDSETIAGFVRVREPSPAAHRPEARDAVILRELKVFGGEVPIGEAPTEARQYQHRGLGAELTAEAERIARDVGARRVIVTAGVGVRAYYARLGYSRLGPYMAKDV